MGNPSSSSSLCMLLERRQSFVRLCTSSILSSLSNTSYSGREFLGPLKSRLAREIGSSNVEFSILIASYSLNNTWTPFVGGLLASKLGTTLSSIIATSIILCGQAILLLGRETENLGLMATGLFIFGLGVSPLAVVQVRVLFYSNPSDAYSNPAGNHHCPLLCKTRARRVFSVRAPRGQRRLLLCGFHILSSFRALRASSSVYSLHPVGVLFCHHQCRVHIWLQVVGKRCRRRA